MKDAVPQTKTCSWFMGRGAMRRLQLGNPPTAPNPPGASPNHTMTFRLLVRQPMVLLVASCIDGSLV